MSLTNLKKQVNLSGNNLEWRQNALPGMASAVLGGALPETSRCQSLIFHISLRASAAVYSIGTVGVTGAPVHGFKTHG